MKRYGNIYEKIYDMENLKLAHKNARKDKLYYREVKMVDSNEEYYLKQIQEILINETYEVSDYVISIINDKGEKLTYSEWCSGNSYKGWLIWCDSYRLSEKYIKPIQQYLDDYYITEIKERKGA